MATQTVALTRSDGSGSPVSVRLTFTHEENDPSGNRSRWSYRAEIVNGSGSVFGAVSWSLAGAHGASGNANLPAGATITVASGDIWINHATDGTLTTYLTFAVSSTNYYIGSGQVRIDATAPRIIRGPRIRVNGTWRNTIAYVRVGGAWRQATPYVRVGGSWRAAG